MNILEVLTAGQGGQIVGNIARSFGIDRKQAADVLTAVVREFQFNMERQSFNRGGLADLVSVLGRQDYSKALVPDAPLTSPAIKDAGIQALDTVLWSKDRSRSVAQRAARESGVDEALVRQMLPSIAAVVMGGIASKANGKLAALASEVGSAPVANVADVAKVADVDVGEQRPLPVPGERPGLGRSNSPYGDLPDVIRRGGTRVPGGNPNRRPSDPGNGSDMDTPEGGISLDQIIRDVLGGVVGFQSKGIIGWIVRYFLVRWGWNFIQSILRRLLTGR